MFSPSPASFSEFSAEALARLLSGLVPPKVPTQQRHPSSNPRESLRKELDQCQNCWRSRGSGKSLMKCAGCRIEKYCSKQCQENAWPSHRVKCKLNRRLQEMPSDVVDTSKALRLFTSKHRPIITQTVARAFGLRSDPTRCLRDVLVIFLSDRRNIDSSVIVRREMSFYATDAQILPVEQLGQQASEVKAQVQRVNQEMRQMGHVGAVFVLLLCGERQITNVSPVGFGEEIMTDELFNERCRIDWKTDLFKHMNEGIVL
ncbi:hypothetical protein BT96DRAFT_1004630 [Gymnopus androsaceus JB14]|uniref:MYND-type domain-containing protein n=1 Tax=Gymnopus androsaceus JB14 TaxID=1447944 RepID=A0A6A4GS43_9AGAR|nr:hypothetical protein BT96DRAFT_1004630 [Gymnopus androsaceus JB14]